MSALRLRLRRGTMVVSMLLLLLTCVAWVHSMRFADSITHWRELDVPPERRLVPDHAHWRNVSVEVKNGIMLVERGTYAYGTAPAAQGLRVSSRSLAYELFLCSPAAADVCVAAAGFSFSRWDRFPSWKNAAVRVPLWSLASASAVMPALGIVTAVRRRRRVGEGCCTACGYDLRATPDRCPECGKVPAEPPTSNK